MFEIRLFRFEGKDWGAGRDFDFGRCVTLDLRLLPLLLLWSFMLLAHLLFLGVLQFLYFGFAFAAYSEGKGGFAES